MKIGIVSDTIINSGGGLHMIMAALSTFKNLKAKDIEVEFICTNKKLLNKIKKEVNIEAFLFDRENLFNRISLFLYKLNFIKYFYVKFLLVNIFEKFLKKKQIDLVFFLSPSSLVLCCNETNFIYTIWEFQHKIIPFFPEYKSNSIENKDELYYFAIKRAFKILLGNNTDQKNFLKTYNAPEDRLATLMFPPYITHKRKEILQLSDKILNKIDKNKFLFYPAQFWAHKNHAYVINAISYINENKNEKIYCFFTGNDKGNLNYIKTLIKKKSLDKYIILLDYLNDDEISLLYQKCLAVIFPSYVGSHSFPLYEGFFYEKPVIYNKYSIDKNLENKILKLDINKIEDLDKILEYMESNENQIKDIILSGKKHFDDNFSERYILEKISKIIIEYKNFSKKWKH